jgi:hypothetical protein
MTMRRSLIALILFLPMLAAPKCWGWGCVGHQVVAYIAAANLNTAAAAKVTDLLSDAEYGNFKRFCSPTGLGKIETFATWADDARTDANAAWHFWDVPLAVKTAAMPKYCDEGCVVSALKAQVTILKDPTSSRVDQQHALMFVIHFVGDAHQPMHIVDNGDRGGNCVPVNFVFKGQTNNTSQGKDKDGNPTGSYSPNLHSIWDSSIIETMTGVEKADDRDKLTQAFADSVAKQYAAKIKAATAKKVNPDTDFEKWALATHALANPKSYAAMSTAIPVDPNPQTLKSCLGVSDHLVTLHEVAQGDFITKAQPVIKQQLALAGGRLAAMLNTIWPASN